MLLSTGTGAHVGTMKGKMIIFLFFVILLSKSVSLESIVSFHKISESFFYVFFSLLTQCVFVCFLLEEKSQSKIIQCYKQWKHTRYAMATLSENISKHKTLIYFLSFWFFFFLFLQSDDGLPLWTISHSFRQSSHSNKAIS